MQNKMVHEEVLLVEGQPVSRDCLSYLSLYFQYLNNKHLLTKLVNV